MRLLSFNVNGLRSIRDCYSLKGWSFDEFLDSLQADVLCFQEVKINEAKRLERELAMPKDFTAYHAFQRGAKKIGYSGVATFCRKGCWEPITCEDGLTSHISPDSPILIAYSKDELQILDSEGRCMITDHLQFVLLNIYFPNDAGPDRDTFRRQFYNVVWMRCRDFLQAGRSIILLGDINVTYHPMDHCDFSKSYWELVTIWGQSLVEEAIIKYLSDEAIHDELPPAICLLIETFYGEKPLRGWLYRLLHLDEEAKSFGLRDAFRLCSPNTHERYTCWSTLVGARGTNHGTRIDTIFVAGSLFKDPNVIIECDIQPKTMGSDHCPVYVDLKLDSVKIGAPAVPQNIKAHQMQRRLSDFFVKRNKDEERNVETAEIPLEPRLKKPATTVPLKLTDYFEVVPRVTNSSQNLDSIESSPCQTSGSQNWREIFHKPKAAPLCSGHSEPCKLMTVNKKGPNRGRQFYICARGVGPVNDPTSRCNYFSWALGNKRSGS
jgi:AP endonuclease-2